MKAFNILVTKRCNLNCKYCYEGKDKAPSNFDESNIKNLLDFIMSQSKCEESIHINFHGGEPLLNFNLINTICCIMKDYNLQVSYSMTTNGLLLEEKIIETIIKNKIYLSISIDGNHTVHDCNRVDHIGMGSYKRVIFNLKKCLRYGMSPRIRMTLCPDTIPFLFDSVLSLYSLGCKNIVAVPNFYDIRWNDTSLKILDKEIKKIDNFIRYQDVSFSFLESIPIEPKGTCQGGVEECSIDVDGQIYPCSFAIGDNELNIGNLKEGINYDKLIKINEINKAKLQECRGCQFEKYCISSRCKILNKKITGDYLLPSALICNFENIVFQQQMFSLSQNCDL